MACEGEIDTDEVRRAAAVLADPEHWLALRGLPSGREAAAPGSDPDAAAAAAKTLAADRNVYYLLNPVPAGHRGPTSAGQVVRRRWLLVDVDPARPAERRDDMATEAEKANAVALAAAVLEGLRERGWPDPVEVDSGNGTHLLYRIDLPNDPAARDLVRRCLAALARLFAAHGAAIDARVFDAPRLAKLPGTWARKGEDAPDRPHRRCRMLSRPEPLEVVPRPLLDALAALAEDDPAPPPRAMLAAGGGPGLTPRERAARYLDAMPEAVSGNGGHDRAFAAARAVVWGFGLGVEAGYELLQERFNSRCRPPWSERELRHKCEDAEKVPSNRPRGWLAAAGREQTPARPPSRPGGQPAETPAGDDRWILEGDAGRIADGHDLDMPDVGQGAQGGPKVFRVESLGTILHKVYPEPRYAVHGLLCEGLNFLFGAPKQGKSMLSLNLALTIAGGGKALGDRQVSQGDVLYLSLEDQARRVKDRAVKMLNGLPTITRDEAAKRLHVVTAWKRQDRGGLAMLDAWIKAAKAPSLIIIDVWNRYCPEARGNASAYSHDADSFGLVKQLADHHKVTVMIVHHTRKAPPGGGAPDDWVAEASGTQGLSGTVDGMLGLFRERGNNQAQLRHTGRDGEEVDLVVEFDPVNLVWRSLGTASQHMEGRVQQKIVAILKARSPYGATCPEVAEAIKEQQACVRVALNRMLASKAVSKSGNLWRWPAEGDEVEV